MRPASPNPAVPLPYPPESYGEPVSSQLSGPCRRSVLFSTVFGGCDQPVCSMVVPSEGTGGWQITVLLPRCERRPNIPRSVPFFLPADSRKTHLLSTAPSTQSPKSPTPNPRGDQTTTLLLLSHSTVCTTPRREDVMQCNAAHSNQST